MADLSHVACDDEVCSEASGKGYYVTARDGPSWWVMLGPFDTHAEALARVEAVDSLCGRLEPKSHFYAFGTSKIASRSPGSINRAGLTVGAG